MGKEYQRWLGDEVARAILEAYKCNNLSEEAQEAFEGLVRQTSDLVRHLPSQVYSEWMTILSEETGVGRNQLRDLVADFKASVRDRGKWPGFATDPHIYEGAGHRRGLDVSSSWDGDVFWPEE